MYWHGRSSRGRLARGFVFTGRIAPFPPPSGKDKRGPGGVRKNPPGPDENRAGLGIFRPVCFGNSPVFFRFRAVAAKNRAAPGKNKPAPRKNRAALTKNRPVLDDYKPVLGKNRAVLDRNRPVPDENRLVPGKNSPVFSKTKEVLRLNRRFRVFSGRGGPFLPPPGQGKRLLIVPKGQPEISQTRSVWNTRPNPPSS